MGSALVCVELGVGPMFEPNKFGGVGKKELALGPLFVLLFLLFLLRRSANNQFLLASAFLPVYTVLFVDMFAV